MISLQPTSPLQPTSESTPTVVNKPRSKKKVRFNLSTALIFYAVNDEGDLDESCDQKSPRHHPSWLDDSEIAQLKATVSHKVRQTREDETLSKGIEKIYDWARRLAISKDDVAIQRKTQMLSLDTCIALWGGSEPIRGVEKYFLGVKSKCGQKSGWKRRCKAYRTMVISHQGKLNEEELRQKCTSLSSQDRLFARMVGEADAYDFFVESATRISSRRLMRMKSLSWRCTTTPSA